MACDKKCCGIACAIVALILVIMIPVGIFGIAPPFAQHAMDQTKVVLVNSTLVPDASLKWGTLHTIMTMDTPGPVTVTIKPFTTTLLTNGKPFGQFTFPGTDAKAGLNTVTFIENFTIIDNDVMTNMTVMMMMAEAKCNLELKGDPEVQVSFLTEKPHQDVNLLCVYVQPTPGQPGVAVTMTCNDDGHNPFEPEVTTTTKKPEDEALLSMVAKADDLPDCSKTACPSKCKCGEEKCLSQLDACLADPACKAGQGCAEVCPCGDNTCLAKCAIKYPSVKALALLTCVKLHCPASAGKSAPERDEIVV